MISGAAAFQFATDDRSLGQKCVRGKRGRVELIAVGGPRRERATETANGTRFSSEGLREKDRGATSRERMRNEDKKRRRREFKEKYFALID